MLLIPSDKQQMVTGSCHLTAVRGTQYPRIKIARASESRLKVESNKLTASLLDLKVNSKTGLPI